MNVRVCVISLALCLASPFCSATISCSDLEPSSPQFSNKLGSVGQQAGIASSRFSQYHRQAILDLCAGQETRVEDLIDQGKVSAREIGAIKRVLVVGEAAAPSSKAGTGTANVKARPNAVPESVVRKPGADEAAGINRAVDQMFTRWSNSWFTDRYVGVSAQIAELMTRDSDFLVKGMFSFTRYGQKATIPFAATLRRANEFVVVNLCYNDTTSGMTDCTSSGESSSSSRLMGAVILGGIISGLSGSASSGSSNQGSTQSAPDCVSPGQSSYGKLNCYSYPIDSEGIAHDYGSNE